MKHEKTASFCSISAVVDKATLVARMGAILEARQQLATLERLLVARPPTAHEQHPCVAGFARQTADKAFDVEKYLRVALYAGVESVNELADTGELESILKGAVDQTRRSPLEPRALAAHLEQCGKVTSEALGIDVSALFDEAAQLAVRYHLQIVGVEDHLVCTMRDEQGERRVAIAASPRPGQMARVSVNEFFSRSGAVSGVLSFVDGDCHHRSQGGATAPDPVGFYDSIIGLFALAREATYRYAREVDELGVPRFSGGGIAAGAIAGIVLAIILILGLIVGAAVLKLLCEQTGDQGLCTGANILGGVAGGIIVIFVFALLIGGSSSNKATVNLSPEGNPILEIPLK